MLKYILPFCILLVVVTSIDHIVKPQGISRIQTYHSDYNANITVVSPVPVTLIFETKDSGIWTLHNVLVLKLRDYNVKAGSVLYAKNVQDNPVTLRYVFRGVPINVVVLILLCKIQRNQRLGTRSYHTSSRSLLYRFITKRRALNTFTKG